LEHSLISISKWEAHTEKPYLETPGVIKGISGMKEERYYFQCMIIGEVPSYVPDILINSYFREIKEYINKPHSATSVYRRGPTIPSRQIVTSELIYYWMIRFGIPIECQRWHFNRLLMLIDVCNVKEQNAQKKGNMSQIEAAQYRHDLNKARRGV
jgi:hypothetical protein